MNKTCLPTTDAELWQAFTRGDENAFDLIFEKHIRLLYNYGHKFTTRTEIIEDCIQDLFVELWEKRARLSQTDSIKFYLFKALRLRIVRRLGNENKLFGQQTDTDIEEYQFTLQLSIESEIVASQMDEEQRKNIALALDNLSKRQKEAIVLKYYNNLTYTQIAGIMDISIDSVYKLISGALSVLKKYIRQVHFSIYWSSISLYTLLFFS